MLREVQRRVGAAAAAAALLTLAIAGSARAATFTKGPYLQALGPTGVTVKLELSEAQAAKVEVFAAGSDKPVASGASDGSSYFQAVRLDGLTAGTAYEYRVTSASTEAVSGRFTTAPAGDPPFRFLVYGDSRTDPAAHAVVTRNLEKAPGEFLINTGDMVMSGKDDRDWRSFFEIERALLRDRCVFAAVGNHELSRGDPASGAAFLRYFGAVEEGRVGHRLYGSFRWSNTRFFLLNAMDEWTGEEREWLRAELDEALVEPGLLHRIAVLHHGPFSSGPHGGNAALARGGVIEMMRDRKVDLVFAGHDHVYERGVGDGLKYVITGGAGAPLYEKKGAARETIVFEAVHHFVEAAIDGDKVKLVARRASGSVIEACGFQGSGGWECDASAGSPAAANGAPAHGAPASPAAPAGPARAGTGCGCGVPGAADPPGRAAAAIAIAAAACLVRRRAGARGGRRSLIAPRSER